MAAVIAQRDAWTCVRCDAMRDLMRRCQSRDVGGRQGWMRDEWRWRLKLLSSRGKIERLSWRPKCSPRPSQRAAVSNHSHQDLCS
ncbi:hypothetical protein IG631_13296 [Alternaria alternata]|nr:hypothetical protein IG631_13296 [Alternaria alternata]